MPDAHFLRMNALSLGALVVASLSLAVTPFKTAASPRGVPDLVSFSPGTVARAADVNSNFSALRTAIIANETGIAGLGGTVTGLTTSVSNLESGVQAAEARISSLEGQLSTAQGSIQTLQQQFGQLQQQVDDQAVGMAVATVPQIFNLTTTPTPAGSITINCPSSGTVFVTYHSYAVFFGENTVLNVAIGTQPGLVSANNCDIATGFLDGAATLREERPLAVAKSFACVPGPNTFYVNVQKDALFSGRQINLVAGSVRAIFVPESY